MDDMMLLMMGGGLILLILFVVAVTVGTVSSALGAIADEEDGEED